MAFRIQYRKNGNEIFNYLPGSLTITNSEDNKGIINGMGFLKDSEYL